MKLLSKITFSSFIFLFLYCISFAQNVTLEGKQFKLNGNNFYPVVMNYSLDMVFDVSPTNNGYFLSPDHLYNITNDYDCNGESPCYNQIQADFSYIAGMKFNTVRTGINIQYNAVNGLFISFTNNDFSTPGPLFTLDPSNPTTDPGMLHVFDFYDKILLLADSTVDNITSFPAPLKVIIGLAGGVHAYDQAQQTAWAAFLSALASYFATCANNDALLAYDLINEPCYFVKPLKTKQDACSMISGWYDSIKNNDPAHLITLGSCGAGDVLAFDPSIVKVDFLSLHTYPSWNEDFEDHYYDTLIQQRGWDRVGIDMFWMGRNSAVPWNRGETSLSAEDNHPFGIIPDATETQQSAFAAYTLDATCNCGGSGYSWWNYEDNNNDINGNTHYGFQGLLRSGYYFTFPADKLVVDDVFRTYSPPVVSSCGPCPVSFSSTYDPALIYYNPFQHPSNPSLTITGTITDQDGNPVKDAYVGGRTYLGQNSQQQDFYDYHSTFSDELGYFELIPYAYIPGLLGGGTMVAMDLSAAGSERRAYGSLNHTDFDPLPATNSNISVTLKRNTFTYNNTINNVTVPSPQTRNFKGYNSLTTTDLTIQAGATSAIVARNEVHLLPGFDADYGSEVHIYCDDQTFSDCGNYSTPDFLMQYRNGSNQNNLNDLNEIELAFRKSLVKNVLLITPNPNTGKFNIRLSQNNSENIINLEINNTLGKKIMALHVNSPSVDFDLSLQPKGVYFLKAETETHSYVQKLIIQ